VSLSSGESDLNQKLRLGPCCLNDLAGAFETESRNELMKARDLSAESVLLTNFQQVCFHLTPFQAHSRTLSHCPVSPGSTSTRFASTTRVAP